MVSCRDSTRSVRKYWLLLYGKPTLPGPVYEYDVIIYDPPSPFVPSGADQLKQQPQRSESTLERAHRG